MRSSALAMPACKLRAKQGRDGRRGPTEFPLDLSMLWRTIRHGGPAGLAILSKPMVEFAPVEE
jgi:hypothetical protein